MTAITIALSKGRIFDETCLLYTSDAADERSSVDLGGRRIIKKKKKRKYTSASNISTQKSNKRRNIG